MKKKLSTVFGIRYLMPMTAQILVKGDYGYLYCHMSSRGMEQPIRFPVMATIGTHGRTLSSIQSMPALKAEPVILASPVCTMARIHHGYHRYVHKDRKWDNYGIDLLKSRV